MKSLTALSAVTVSGEALVYDAGLTAVIITAFTPNASAEP